MVYAKFSSKQTPYLDFKYLFNHHIWRLNKIGESPVRIKKGVKVDEENISSVELHQLIKAIQRLDFDLRKFTETEIVPVVLAPIWKNKEADSREMWMVWSMQYRNLDEETGNIYLQFVKR